MRRWPKVLFAAALVASVGAAQAQTRSGEDCTKRVTHAEQIDCLQLAIVVLQRQVLSLLTMRELELSPLDQVLIDGSLEAMIDRKIRNAMEPRLRLLQRP